MEEAGTQNLSAYIRKMALNGYVLNVDLAPVRELVSLQRRCAANINQVAIHVTHRNWPEVLLCLLCLKTGGIIARDKLFT